MQQTRAAFQDEIREQYGSKVAELVIQVHSSLLGGGKVVIFSSWNRLLDLAKLALESTAGRLVRVASMHTTKTETVSAADRQQALLDFQLPIASGGAHVLLLVLGTQDAGLNLNQARTVILMEPQLTSTAETQAAGRITRIGQRHETNFIRLIVQHTVEPHIWRGASSASGGMEERSAAREASLYAAVDEHTGDLIRLSEPPSVGAGQAACTDGALEGSEGARQTSEGEGKVHPTGPSRKRTAKREARNNPFATTRAKSRRLQ